jgi:hypothetical protein
MKANNTKKRPEKEHARRRQAAVKLFRLTTPTTIEAVATLQAKPVKSKY